MGYDTVKLTRRKKERPQMEQHALDAVKTAATGAGAAALLGFKAGEEIATIKANAAADITKVDPDGWAVPLVIKADGTITAVEQYGSRPVMIRQDVTLHDTVSFADYVNRFKDSNTVVFGDQIALSFGAVLDYHEAPYPEASADARWCRHRAIVTLLQTDEWKDWTSKHGKEMNQTDFSAWFEDRIPDIKTPDSAVIIEMARKFEAKKDVSYNGRIDPDTGSVALRYDETVSGVQREGSVAVVRKFVLEIVPFLGAEKVEVEARIRWRVTDGELLLRYELIRHKQVLEAAFRAEFDDVKATIPGVTILAGPIPSKG